MNMDDTEIDRKPLIFRKQKGCVMKNGVGKILNGYLIKNEKRKALKELEG